MEQKTTRDELTKMLVLFFTTFYMFWALMELLIIPFLDKTIGNETINTFIVDVVIKNLTWTLPAVLLIHKYRLYMYLEPKRIITLQKEKMKWLLAVPGVIVYVLILSICNNGEIRISSDFGMPSIWVVLFVGITEEAVFRGWLLNVVYKEENKTVIVLLNAVLFLAIHFPKWLRTGCFLSLITSFSFLTIMLLSVFFSILFIKSESLLVPILTHSVYDLMVMMLF